jgi:hypothetical protein
MTEIKQDKKWIKSQIDHYIKIKNYSMARKQARAHDKIHGFDANQTIIEINQIEEKETKKDKGKVN